MSEVTALPFDNVHLNIGDGFDINSTHFVAPVSGIYSIGTSVRGVGNVLFWIVKNGAFHARLDLTDTLFNAHASTTISLLAGDAVWIAINVDGEAPCSVNLCRFHGHLLHQLI